jgi:SagB-type dehydrogenase family enzyme
MDFPLKFHFKNQPNHTVAATMDSPARGATAVPLNDVKQAGMKVEVGIRVAHASFRGTLNKEGTELAGEFIHEDQSVPLTLRKTGSGSGSVVKPIDLPAPQTDGGKPLMQALKARQSAREFGARIPTAQVLSNLLWAANGINRADGRRTAPTASNKQEIDIYVITADGLYLYDPKSQKLNALLAGDLRTLAGTQDYVKTAPVNLVYVADYAKYDAKLSDENRLSYSWADTGYVSQNVYLFCASEGLSTVVRAGVDRAALGKAMQLRPEQRIILQQPVGYPN